MQTETEQFMLTTTLKQISAQIIANNQGLFAIDQKFSQLNSVLLQILFPTPPTHKVHATKEAGDYALRVLGCLKPMDVVNKGMVRLGRPYDGGYVMLDEFPEIGIAYSLGINDDVSWDLDIASRGLDIFQYDHTIKALPENHPRFRFFPIGIGECSQDPRLKPLAELLELNQHLGRRDMILKMDIEGAEWDMFAKMDDSMMEHFSQIVMEIHNLEMVDQLGFPEKVVHGLERMNRTHQVVHVHANNHGYTCLLGGVFLCNTYEVTYVRKSDHAFTECRKSFPTELDMPCDKTKTDLYLGKLGL